MKTKAKQVFRLNDEPGILVSLSI